MNNELEKVVYTLIILCKNDHLQDLQYKDYSQISNRICNILYSVERLYGIDTMMQVIYRCSNILGYSFGPLSDNLTIKLIHQGCFITKIICPR